MERNIGILIGFLEAHNASTQVMQAAQDIFTLCKEVNEDVDHQVEAKPISHLEDVRGLIDRYLNEDEDAYWRYGSCEIRAKNILKLHNIKTMDDVYEFSKKRGIYLSLLRLPNCGRKTIQLILNSIKYGGYKIDKNA